MPVAHSYIRMSRPEQMRGDSLRRQTENARAWASKRGITIDETLRDIGVSAYRGKNRTSGALAAYLKMVEDGRVARGSYLIVESLDRLSREAVLETMPRFIDLINAGIVIVTLMDEQEYSKERLTADWTPLILSIAIMARAHEESQTKAKRILASWDKKIAAASEKLVTRRVPAWIEVTDGKMILVPKRAETVRRIFRETAAGSGRRAVVKRLNADKVPSFQGKDGWQESYVAKLMANRAVMGEFQAYRRDASGVRQPVGDPVEDYFPAVVTAAEFHAARLAVRSRTAAPGRRGEDVTNLFLGLAKCAACGATMRLENKGPRSAGHRYLFCSKAARQAGCTNDRRWSVTEIEPKVLSALRNADLKGFGREDDAGLDAAAAALTADLDDARVRRERLLALVEDGDVAAVQRYKDLGKRVAELEREVGKAREAADAAGSSPTWQERSRRLAALIRGMQEAVGDERRSIRTEIAQLLRITLARVTFGQHRIAGHYHDARLRYRPDRVVARPGEALAAYQVTLFDDAPVILDDADIAALEDADGEGSRPLPARWRR
ncbi:recombinase family protein [Methylorubrum populi]|uniref:recombinase family protein n=1 Tax=Methylorubrum rhodesianum TaxID=29427 RepID=UPI00190B40FD|nr:recombinase family protein [Methylorubrum rhodesianum]MBK3404163.1 recombinase family protein [Methylorubrum rhodesianum]MBY0142953.1 recombinase family protein [Methylorubrum populi]